MCNMTLIWSLSHFTSMVKSSPGFVVVLTSNGRVVGSTLDSGFVVVLTSDGRVVGSTVDSGFVVVLTSDGRVVGPTVDSAVPSPQYRRSQWLVGDSLYT